MNYLVRVGQIVAVFAVVSVVAELTGLVVTAPVVSTALDVQDSAPLSDRIPRLWKVLTFFPIAVIDDLDKCVNQSKPQQRSY